MVENKHFETGKVSKKISEHSPGHLKAKKQSKIPVRIFYVIAALIAITLVFYLSFFFIMRDTGSSYKGSINKHTREITTINSSIIILNEDKTFISDSKTIASTLSAAISKLQVIQTSVNGLVPTTDYKTIQDNIKIAIENNINVLRQVNSILESPENSDVSKSVQSLVTYYNLCKTKYDALKTSGIDIDTQQTLSDIVTATTTYVDTVLKLKNDEATLKAQNLQFINDISNLYNNFNSIRVEYTSTAATARNGSISYEVAINSIQNNIVAMEAIQGSYDKLVVATPDTDAKGIYDTLGNLLSKYSDYLMKFKYSLSAEAVQSQSTGISDAIVVSLYSKPNSIYNSLSNENADFIQQYNNFKIKITSK